MHRRGSIIFAPLAKLDADPRSGRLDLRYAVAPRALAGPAHDQQVAAAEVEAVRPPAGRGLEQEPPRRPEGEDRHHGVRDAPSRFDRRASRRCPGRRGTTRAACSRTAAGSAVPAQRRARASAGGHGPSSGIVAVSRGTSMTASYIARRSVCHSIPRRSASNRSTCPGSHPGRSPREPRSGGSARDPFATLRGAAVKESSMDHGAVG